EYIVGFYTSAVRIALALYTARHSDSVRVPVATADVPTFKIGHIVAPDTDIDDPMFIPLEKYIPRFLWRAMLLPGMNCYMSALRASPFDDMLLDDGNNTWGPLLRSGKYPRKKDWLMTFYEQYTMWDGTPVYPPVENNFAQMFWKHDQWDDQLEKAMAFDLIGAHRLKPVHDRSVGGETLAFVIAQNDLSAMEVRAGFAKYGSNMYFSAEGMPLMIVTTDGREVLRGDKDWQYWKFVWRSTLVSSITLVDHLHLAHFHSANTLARAIRKSLHHDHPIRRFLSIFTFGSIWVNNIAMHTLLGPKHVLHRSLPFQEFEGLSDAVPSGFPDLWDWHKDILDDEAFEALPAKIKETPYYADGRLLVQALKRLLDDVSGIYAPDECENGRIKDLDIVRFRLALVEEAVEGGYTSTHSQLGGLNCSDQNNNMILQSVLANLWTVTGWHRHVGTVGDYYADPDLAAFGWKEGELGPRPKQTMLMSVVAAFTSTPQPKLIEDYTHVFKGMQHEDKMVAAWKKFRGELYEIQKEIRTRNARRTIKNAHMDPAMVECSVAV
ncbi:unnamed protein product, partial [Polarella glacialis]